MAQNDWWNNDAPAGQPAGDDWWKSDTPADPPKPRTRGLFEAVNDNVIEFANAAAGGVSALANMVKPGNAVSGFIDENIIKAGEAKQSDVVQGAKRQLSQGLDNAQGIGEEVGAVGRYVLDNPLLAASQAAGSFALPAGTVKGAGMAAKALGAGVKGVETAGRVGGVAAGAAMAGGDAAGTAYDLSKNAGATDEQATAAGRQASVIPALVGGVTGAFGAERLLAGAKGFGGNALSRGLKSGLSEAGQEAVEEGVTQFEGQRAAMPYDSTIDPTKGVAGAAAMGGIMGFGPGAVLGAIGDAKPSQQMGIDPNAGPLSRAAASAVDSQPVPPAGGMGFNPDAGATTVFPDGSQSMNSEMAAEEKVGQPVVSEQKYAVLKESAPVAPVPEPQPPRVQVGQDPNSWSNQNAQLYRDQSDKAGLTAEIEGLFAQGATAQQALNAVKSRLSFIPKEDQAGWIVGVRATLGIPSRIDADGAVEFNAWKAEYEKRKAASSAKTNPTEPVPLEQRSLDELRQAFRSAQDPAIRKTLAAEIRKRREAMPDPLAPVQPQQEIALEPQAVQSQPQEAPPAALGKPLTETGAGMLGRGADPLQSIIQGQADERRAADVLRGTRNSSSGAGADIADAGVANDVGSPDRTTGAAAPVVPEQGQSGAGERPAADQAALRPDGWRTTAIKAGKVARSLGLDPKGKRLKEIVAEIDAVDAGSGVAAKPVSREQAIRDAWRKEPRTIGKWTPISVEAEGQKADMLVNQKRAGGDKDGALHVVNIRMGKMLKDMEREPIAYTFRLTADNRLVEEGIPTVATPGQIAAWNGAGFTLDDKPANVQNTPSSTAGTEAKAAPVEARAPEGGNAAADTGVPAAPGAGDVQADGVKQLAEKAKAAQAETRRVGESSSDMDELQRVSEAEDAANERLSGALEAIPDDRFGVQAKTTDGRQIILTPSAQKPGQWQLTRFARDGAPWGDSQYTSKKSAILDFLREVDIGTLEADGLSQLKPEAAKAPADPVQPAPPAKKIDRAASLRKAEWKKNPLRSFLGQHGLSIDLAKEFAPGVTERRKAMVGGYGPIFRKAGKSLDLLAEIAREEGFISADQDATDLYELVAAVFRGERVAPMFTADAAQDEMQARMDAMQQDAAAGFDDFLAEQQAAGDPLASLLEDEYTLSDIEGSGYAEASPEIKAEVAALSAQLEVMGVDVEGIAERIAQQTTEKTAQEYHEALQSALQKAHTETQAAQPAGIRNTGENGRSQTGSQSWLTAPTSADIEAQQDRAEQADKLDERAQVKRESEAGDTSFMTGFDGDGRQDTTGGLFDAPVERFEAGKSLTKEQRKTVLASLVDVYKQKGADREMKGMDRNGNERFGYVHSPDLFEKSDITGSMVRYYVTLPDGRKAHPTELFPDYTQSDIDAEMTAREQRKRDRASDVNRATVPAQQFSTIREAVEWWDKRSRESMRTANGLPTIFPSEERRPLTNGSKFILVPNTTSGEMLEAFADAGWKVARAAPAAPAQPAQLKAEKPAEDDAFMGVKADPRNLVAMHNLTADNLLYADSIGGIPVPSIGITKIDSPFNGFGDVTLIAPSSMIDPEQGTPVFDRDAWTARFPTMNFKKVKAKVADAFYERMRPVDGMGNDGGQFLSMLWEETRNASVQRPDKVADLFRRYNAPKMLYAKDVLGKEIKVPMRAAQLSSPAAEDKQLQAYWKKSGNRLIALDREMSGFDFSNSPEYKAFMAEIEGAVRRYAIANDKADRADSYVEMFLPDGQLGPGGFNRIRKDFEQVGKKEVDGVKLSEAVRKAVPDNDPAYDRWVKSLVEPLFEAPTITVRGREVEPTLENIVDAMTVGATAGAEKSLTFGPGKTAAMLGKRFKSLSEIKADRDRVVSQDQENEGKKATEELLNQYRAKATAFFKGTDWRGNIDTWAANDASMEALAKAGKAGGSNADIRQALVRAGFKQVDQATVDLASESIKALRTAATDYFEAKPQRAVKLSEFRAAVVPKGVSQEVKDVLTKNGIEVVEYNKKTEGARDAAIQKTAKRVDKAAKDILFMGDKAKAQRQGTPVDRAIMEMAGEGREANEILSFIAKSSKSPYRRQLAQKLLATGANPAVSLGGEMGGGAGFRFLAKYSRKNHEVTLSEAAGDRAEQIFLHETVHAATLLALDKGGLFATQMNRLYESAKKQGGADGQYGLKNVGEFVAEAFTNPDFQKALKGMKADNGSLWDRLVNIVRQILGMEPNQQDALSKALELGAGVMRENIPLRAAKSFRAEDGPAFAGADQTETPEFKRWFGDSKVVDANGKPLVVYHGTTRGLFSAFKLHERSRSKGFVFTSDRNLALTYSGQDNSAEPGQRNPTKSGVYETFLSLQNPKVIDWEGKHFSENGGTDAAIQKARDEGYDGLIMRSVDDAGMYKGMMLNRKAIPDDTGVSDIYVAFRPEQIKSAIGNNGNFNPDDADIANFGIADAVEQIKQFDVKSAPKQTLAHYRGMALQALGRRQLVDLYAEELPQLETYNDLVQQMDAEKNDTGAEADRVAQDWGSLKGGMDRKLAELMHDATLAKMDPDKPMPAGYFKRDYDALKARFDALSPEAKTLYRKARDMYVDHYKAVQQAIKDRVERSEMSEGQKRKMMADLDDKLFKELKGVYFPLARFGQYVIVVKDANGEVVNVTRAETIKEAEQARKELQKAFPASSGNTVGKVLKQAEFNAGRDAVGKGFMADLMGALDEKGVDDELRDTVAQLYLSSLPDLSWAKHGIHRKGTPGFSQDARRAFAQNMFHGARYLAKLRHADRLQDLLIEMQDHIKAYEGVEEYDSVQAQQVVDEMVKRHEWLMNPKASPVSTALTSFGFLFHMGLSPASAMVNLTQTALVAYPQMGAKWGFARAGAALTKASEETVRAKNDLSQVLKGDELDAFNRAVKDGTIDVTMAHDLAGIAQGEDQGVMWKIRPVMRWASFMFHHAEKFNRQATFLAAYRLAKATNPAATQSQLYEQAKQATYDGHFDYSSSNRARIMQGNWQRVIFLFKQYAQSMVYTLARNAYQSVKALEPKERSQARKTLGGILAAHAAAAGVLGLPIVGPLLTVASWIGGDDDEPWDAEVAMQNAMAEMIGPKAAEVVARGFSRLTPFDLSGRVALNKLILPDVQEGLEGKEWAESAMAAALGPVAGIGVNMARGAQKITEGDYLRGLEDMMPTALRGPLKAMRYASEGAVDKTGVTITEDVSAAGVLGQASGFSPSQVRRDTERRSAIYSYDRALLERRSVLMRMFAQAQMSGDLETAQEVRQDIQRFNEKNPTRRITPMNLAASIRNRRKRIEEAEQGVYLPSKRRDALEAVTF